jgi:molybdopterin converting factor subunit 1
MKQVLIQYFALLREQAGCREETLATTAADAAELYEQARDAHGFTLPRTMLRVAVNDEFCAWSTPVSSGDRIVFIPPVAGG